MTVQCQTNASNGKSPARKLTADWEDDNVDWILFLNDFLSQSASQETQILALTVFIDWM